MTPGPHQAPSHHPSGPLQPSVVGTTEAQGMGLRPQQRAQAGRGVERLEVRAQEEAQGTGGAGVWPWGGRGTKGGTKGG